MLDSILNQDKYTLSLLVISIFTIVLLVSIILFQNKKIRDMNRKTYGFLGKPLAFFAMFMFSIGAFSVLFFNGQASQPATVSVTDQNIYEAKIVYSQVNETIYRLNAIPVINNVDWGNDPERKFDVYWTINSVDTKIEYGLTKTFTGGIITNLQKGTNTVSATYYVNETPIVEEIQIELE